MLQLLQKDFEPQIYVDLENLAVEESKHGRTEALDALKTFHRQKGLPKGGKTKIGPEAGKLLVENPVGNGVAVEAQ